MNRRRLSSGLACALLTLICAVSLQAQGAPKKPVKKKAPATKTTTSLPEAKVELAPESPPKPADVRLHTTLTTGAQISGSSTLIRGQRQRVEFPGMTVIQQCDLGRTLQVNDTSRRYLVQKHAAAVEPAAPEPTPVAAQMPAGFPAMPGAAPAQPGGVITWTTTTTDTGERAEAFGRQARHVKTVTVGQSGPKACQTIHQRIEVDAWYIDVPEALAGCSPTLEAAAPPPPPPGACVDRTETRRVGTAALGFPVKATTTTTMGEGDAADTNTTTLDVDALEVTDLAEALFDVPEGYTETASYGELLPKLATGGTLADALLGSVSDGTRVLAPKALGAVRIGVVQPSNKTDRVVGERELQEELVGNFTKWPNQAVPLAGDSPETLQQDAVAKECDYILISTLTEAKTSKPGKMAMLKMVTGDGPPKDNHDVKMEYKLFALDAPAKARASATSKANNGGGFGLKSALKLAMFAGQMYMGMGGMNMGMMSGFGGLGNAMAMMGGGMSPMAGMFNPTMGAMNMAMMGASTMGAMAGSTGNAGGMDMAGMQSDQEFRQTMSKALDGVSSGVAGELKKSPSKAGK